MPTSLFDHMSKRSSIRNAPYRRHGAPMVEPLDPRVMLTVTALFSFAAGELRVTGDDSDNVITISRNAGGALLVNNGAIAIQGGTPTISNTVHFHLVGAGGNDVITLDESNGELPGAAMFGGTGNDTLTGGSGIDFADGEAGNDVISLGRADDEFQWNPGDGSDVVDGQAGTDSMVFNGSDLSERFEISDSLTGTPFHRVRLTRDLGGVVMDLGGIESIDLNTLGGPDLVTVNDQTATDIFSVNVDLSGPTGTGDAQPDTVIVNGTDLDDVGQISNFGSRIVAVVSTFPAVSIIGAEPASDLLVVNGLGGNDELDASALSAGMIGLVLNGGLDDDQITGSGGTDSIIGGAGTDRIFMGGGDDSFFWNAGDGSDLVEGQSGIDTLNFNGSIDAENFDLSANGPRLRLTRDVDNIAMDVDGVEQVAVTAVNGGDTFVLNDLTGTAVTAVKFVLSGRLQLDADHVILNGSSGADTIDVDGDFANGLTITGLSARVRIGALEGPVDSVTINGLGGADTVDASGLAAGAVSFSMDGGAGNDTLIASQGDDRINGGTQTDTINVVSTEPGEVVTLLPSSGDDTLNVNTDGSGTARVAFDATQRIGALNIGSGGFASVTSGGAKVLTVTSLNLSGSGSLDLNDNDMILDYPDGGSSPIASVRSAQASALNGGAWNGPGGITSTRARNDASRATALGYMEASDFKARNGAAVKPLQVGRLQIGISRQQSRRIARDLQLCRQFGQRSDLADV